MKTEKNQELLRRLRVIYGEIIQGKTYNTEEEVYLKHPTEQDISAVEYMVEIAQEEAIQRGLKTEEEIIKEAMDDGIWTIEQEAEVTSLQKAIEGSRQYRDRTHSNDEKKQVEERIEEYQKKLQKISEVRESLLENTKEKYLNQKRSDFTVLFAFYKDENLKEPILTQEEFDELEIRDVHRLVSTYYRMTEDFSPETLKRIACQPFFLNKFFLSENDPTTFYGTHIINLTIYQSEIYAQGKMYRGVLETAEGEMPPDNYYDDPDKLVSWYYGKSQVNSTQGEGHNKSVSKTLHGNTDKDFVGGASIVGASAEELRNLEGKDAKHVDLNSKLQKIIDEKGEYDMFDVLEIHGVDTSGQR